MAHPIDRRDFIKQSAAAGIGLAFAPGAFARAPIQKKNLRLGIIGVGLRGCGHLRNMLFRDDVDVVAICDVNPERIEVAQKMLKDAGVVDKRGPKRRLFG